MRGNILTQTNWQVKAVFTLTVLFATTCLFLTNLSAQQNENNPNMVWRARWELNGDVWVEASVCVGYNAPYLSSGHCVYVWNTSKKHEVKCYSEFDAKVTGVDKVTGQQVFNDHQNEKGEGTAPAKGGTWSDSETFSFDLSGKAGKFTITSFSDIEVKRKNGGETGGFRATITRTFRIE